MREKIKVLFLNPTIPPRSVRLLNNLSRQKDIDLTVFFYSVSAKNRRWNIHKQQLKFKYSILDALNVSFGIKDYIPFSVSFNFPKKLLRIFPDAVIVPGWADFPSFFSAIYCRVFGKKLILRSESTIYEKSWRRTLFKPLVKFMINSATVYIAAGTRAKEYLIKLGANRKKIIVGYSAIENDRFKKDSSLDLYEIKGLKENLGIHPNDIVVMFNGQFIIRKGIFDLLGAFTKIIFKYPSTKLLMIGYGREEKSLRIDIGHNQLEDKIIIAGFIDNKLLPKYYGIADMFVLPSREETWGIVVNEAMACGLPIIVGDKVGCGRDLVRDNVNGLVFKSGSVKGLTQALERLIKDKTARHKFGNKSYKIISRYDLAQLEGAILRGIRL